MLQCRELALTVKLTIKDENSRFFFEKIIIDLTNFKKIFIENKWERLGRSAALHRRALTMIVHETMIYSYFSLLTHSERKKIPISESEVLAWLHGRRTGLA
jgi:hypothetical protein